MPKLCKKVIKPSLHNEFTKIVTVKTSFSDYFLAQQKNVSLALDMRTPEPASHFMYNDGWNYPWTRMIFPGPKPVLRFAVICFLLFTINVI